MSTRPRTKLLPPGPRRSKSLQGHPACKICNSEFREEIEELIAFGQLKLELTDPTQRPTMKWLQENAPAMWGMPLYPNTLTGHKKRHMQILKGTEVELVNIDAARTVLDKLERGEIMPATADEYLGMVVTLGMEKLKANPGAISHDQVLKAIAELTKRKHDDHTADLMRLLGESQARALDKAMDVIAAPKAPEIEGEIVEAEVVGASEGLTGQADRSGD